MWNGLYEFTHLLTLTNRHFPRSLNLCRLCTCKNRPTEFKTAVLLYKALNGLSPQYLVDNCQLITTTGRRRLRSSNVATFHEPAQLWEIDPSLLLVHVCGTIYHFISVTLNYHFTSFTGYWKRICLADDPIILDIVHFTNVLTYLSCFPGSILYNTIKHGFSLVS